MEEELKILEEMKFWEGCETTIDEKWCKALENLLTRYKEERDLRIHYENRLDNMERLYIDKDKVKEKIEELKEIADEDNLDEFIKIRALQELLE